MRCVGNRFEEIGDRRLAVGSRDPDQVETSIRPAVNHRGGGTEAPPGIGNDEGGHVDVDVSFHDQPHGAAIDGGGGIVVTVDGAAGNGNEHAAGRNRPAVVMDVDDGAAQITPGGDDAGTERRSDIAQGDVTGHRAEPPAAGARLR